MKKKMTKKEYEEHLNEIGVPEHDRYEEGGRCKSDKYGTWLRANDPIAFQAGYNDDAR